jgi:hypothetical protein
MTVLAEFPPDFAVVDGYEHAPDGILGVLGSPRAQTPRRIYAGADALAVDLTVARHLGLLDPRKSPLLQTAIQWFGDPSSRVRIVGEDSAVTPWRGPAQGEWNRLLSSIAYPVYVLASMRGAIFVPDFDLVAFPPLAQPSAYVRIARALVQRAFGLKIRS